MSWPSFVGAAAILIEPTPLRPNHPCRPRRGEQMDGTRVLGLPASIDWQWGWTAAHVPDSARQGFPYGRPSAGLDGPARCKNEAWFVALIGRDILVIS
jgi:hypothetical protein